MKRRIPDPDWYDYEEPYGLGGVFGGTFAIVLKLQGCGDWARKCRRCGKQGDIYMWVTKIGGSTHHGADHACCCLNQDCEVYWRKVYRRIMKNPSGFWKHTKEERVIWDDRAVETWNNLYGK